MELNRNNIKKILFIITFALLLFWVLNYPEQAGKILKGFLALLLPFLLGCAFAFIMNVLLKSLEKLWDKIFKKAKLRNCCTLKRAICMVISLLIIAVFLIFLLLMVIPEVYRTGEMLVSMLPQYMQQLEGWWNSLADFLKQYSIALPENQFDFNQMGESISEFLSTVAPTLLYRTFDITTSVFSVVFNIVLGLVFALYVLAQKEKLKIQLTKVCQAYLSEEKSNRVLEIAAISNHTFGKFVTGQLTEAFIIGILCFLGMTVFGIPYAPMISVLVGFSALIPVFGAFIGTAIGAFLILMVSPIKAFWFVVFIIILQQLEGNLIYPRVVGKSVGLSGIWVLTAVALGGGLFGILGMLLSVPICSVIYTVFSQNVNKRLALKKIEKEKSLQKNDK